MEHTSPCVDGWFDVSFEAWLTSLLRRHKFHKLEYVQNGGHGVVYRCRDWYTDAQVVIKVIPLSRPCIPSDMVVDTSDVHAMEELEKAQVERVNAQVERTKAEVEHEQHLLAKFGFESFAMRRACTKGLSLDAEDGTSVPERGENLEFYDDGIVVNAAMTSSDFCCFGHVDDGEDRCVRCRQRAGNHIPGLYPVVLMMIDYRGVELYEFMRTLAVNPSQFRRNEIAFSIISASIGAIIVLWDHGYAHRDIKAENIAVDDDLHFNDFAVGNIDTAVSLIDFGTVRSIDWERRQLEPMMDELSPSFRTYGKGTHRSQLHPFFKDGPDVDLIHADVQSIRGLIKHIVTSCRLSAPIIHTSDIPPRDISWMGIRPEYKIGRIIGIIDDKKTSSLEKKNAIADFILASRITFQHLDTSVPTG